jgi:UPF0755 protein
MKKIYFLIVFILAALIFSVSYFIYWFKRELGPVSASAEKVSFIVEKGISASEVGEILYQNKLIRNKLVFKLYVQVLDKAKNINAGEFELSPTMSIPEIVITLGKGPKELWVTIPEGLRKEEIAEKIVQALEIEAGETNAFRDKFLSLAKTYEGYLFPDTYLFPRDVPVEIVFGKLKSTFDEKYGDGVESYAKGSKYSKNEIVTMASILERETKSLEEKPVVAGILWKRIENDWPLQVDASVQYAIANSQLTTNNLQPEDWWPVLTLDDLNIDSPYNTYKYRGLPPGPISNPGLVSLQSAAKPEGSDYWFYIHSPDGQIHYAKTPEEHASNVRKYLGKN